MPSRGKAEPAAFRSIVVVAAVELRTTHRFIVCVCVCVCVLQRGFCFKLYTRYTHDNTFATYQVNLSIRTHTRRHTSLFTHMRQRAAA